MASAFKQQCPSCEAMVPIRDPALIGRKIDCPTCKYRFVVEEPADAADEEEPAAKAKVGEAAAKGKPAGKSAPAKTKPGRRRDEDDEEEDRPRSKSDGGSTKLVVGLLVGVVGVALIGVAVYFGFIHDSDGSKPNPPPIASNPTKPTPTPATNPGGEATQGTGETEKTEGVRGRGGILGPGGVTDPTQGQPGVPAAPNPADLYSELTNLLPIDTEGVIHVPFKALQGTPLGRMAFDSPGTFTSKEFENRVGISLNEVERFVQAISFRKNWTFQVVKTTQPMDVEAVKKALQLKAAPGGASDYFLSQSSDWVDLLFRYKSAFAPTPLRTLAVKFHDPKTLVFGDEEPIRGFLTASGRFPPVHKGEFLPFTQGSPAPGGTPPPEVVPGRGTPFADPGRQGTPGGTPEAVGPPQRPYYITVPAELKGMLDRLEDRPTLVSMAFDTRASKGQLTKFIPTFLNLTLTAGFTPQQIEQGRVLGLAVHPLRNGLNLQAQLDCADIATSRVLRKTLQEHGTKLAKVLEMVLGVKATVANDQPEPEPGPGGESEGGRTNVLTPRVGIGGRGTSEGGLVVTPPGGRRPGGTPEEPSAAENTSTVETVRQERTVAIRVNLVFDNDAFRKVETLVKQHVQAVRVDQEMATGQPRWNEVGAATLMHNKAKGDTYPRGTYHREPDGNRAGVPYPPAQRVSWMASLLPHLGYDVSIDHGKSWQDKDNLAAASMLVPQFLDPRSPRSTWFVRQPGMTQDVGATHLVGMAGVGVEAAEYKMNDPNVKSKLGVFGYDRATKASDITDGAQYTIMMIQVPPTFKRPWMAGGGATVMGVPDPNPPRPSQKSISPFVSTEHGGRKGTMAIMADGSVRFIPADTSDEVFKAMCTIQGGDQTFRDDQAPLVKGTENVATIRTAPTPTSGVPNKQGASGAFGEWKEFVSAEWGFSVSMPGTPVSNVDSVVGAGPNAKMFTCGIQQDEGSDRERLVGIVVAPTDDAFVQKRGQEATMNGIRDVWLKQTQAKILSEKPITIQGNPGKEMTLNAYGRLNVKARILLTKNRVYLMFGGAGKSASPPVDVDKFLGSFKLL